MRVPAASGTTGLSRKSRTCAAVASTSAGRCANASATAPSTRRNDGMPNRSLGGKYVPAKNGAPSGRRNTVIGHPPEPVRPCTARM